MTTDTITSARDTGYPWRLFLVGAAFLGAFALWLGVEGAQGL